MPSTTDSVVFDTAAHKANAEGILYTGKAAVAAKLQAMGLKVAYAYTTNREDVALADRGDFVSTANGGVVAVSVDGTDYTAQLQAILGYTAPEPPAEGEEAPVAPSFELPKNTVVTLLVKGEAPVEPYTDDEAGWKQELADNATRVEGAGTLVTFTYNVDDLMRLYYQDGKGLILPSSLWENGYLAEVRLDMKHFHKGVGRTAADARNFTKSSTVDGKLTVTDNNASGEAIDAMIEVLGITDTVGNVSLSSEFNTTYDSVYGTNSWDYTGSHYQLATPLVGGNNNGGAFLRQGASLYSQIEPVKPQIQTYTYVGARGAADETVPLTGQKNLHLTDGDANQTEPTETLLGNRNSGWRMLLANPSGYAMDSGRLVADTMYMDAVEGEWRGFDTDTITLSPKLVETIMVDHQNDLIPLPKLTGVSLETAMAQLEALGLNVEVVYNPDYTKDELLAMPEVKALYTDADGNPLTDEQLAAMDITAKTGSLYGCVVTQGVSSTSAVMGNIDALFGSDTAAAAAVKEKLTSGAYTLPGETVRLTVFKHDPLDNDEATTGVQVPAVNLGALSGQAVSDAMVYLTNAGYKPVVHYISEDAYKMLADKDDSALTDDERLAVTGWTAADDYAVYASRMGAEPTGTDPSLTGDYYLKDSEVHIWVKGATPPAQPEEQPEDMATKLLRQRLAGANIDLTTVQRTDVGGAVRTTTTLNLAQFYDPTTGKIIVPSSAWNSQGGQALYQKADGTITTDPTDATVYMVQAVDDNGDPKFEIKTDAEGNELQVQDKNPDGSLKFYDDGTPVMVPDYKLDGSGNKIPVMVPGAHPGNYLIKATLHFENFGQNIAVGDKDYYVDFYGRPTRAATMSLTGTWSTDYKSDAWNGYWPRSFWTWNCNGPASCTRPYGDGHNGHYNAWDSSSLDSWPYGQANLNNVDGQNMAYGTAWDAERCTVHRSSAWMKATTAEPEVYNYFNWTGGVTNENHLKINDFNVYGNRNDDTVPYRWGQADNEKAWYVVTCWRIAATPRRKRASWT